MKITPLRRAGALVATLALAAGTLGATSTSASAGTTGVLTGTVLDTNGAPVARTFVTINSQIVPTDDNGTFAVTVPAGTYTVGVNDDCNVLKDFFVQNVIVAADVQQSITPRFTESEPNPDPSPQVCPRVLPRIIGTPQLDVPLTATSGVYAQAVSSITYQWFVGVSRVPGATGPTYVPTIADIGKAVYVELRVYSPEAAMYYTPAFPDGGAVRAGAFSFSATPTVSGLPIIGRTLSASPGALTPGAAVSYQWFRDGRAITGRTARTYRVAKADYKKRITATVTYSRPGYTTVVGQAGPSYRAKRKGKVSARTSVRKRTVTIKVAVSPRASKRSKGKIIVLENGRTLKRASVRAGTSSVKVTGLKRGRHRLTIVFDGSKNLGTTAKTVRVRG
ncbi:carboxypeptidase regulatory-like domain-containing protein [Aeromicrobium sp. CFBP 8757]|uniref:carboxypeptidase-like regulatory domain-containing protein n=1 Tax=Aeromicrobium sp. CFBP 8757 TaxID=2775288 RepID=UPI001784F5EC|nr:carboxypeptidase-like regulatory domain-containing protein [Aeromicrobium sp. CFBP 8757]MBD8608784.1 carboxypeptidase regulatory-like domain-containing protein [Aeromicrobium sp. CFBP 8757]